MDIETVFTADYTYWVEILHTGSEHWTHIHCPDWETSDSYADAMIYAQHVRTDHPGSQIRIVERVEGCEDHYIPAT